MAPSSRFGGGRRSGAPAHRTGTPVPGASARTALARAAHRGRSRTGHGGDARGSRIACPDRASRSSCSARSPSGWRVLTAAVPRSTRPGLHRRRLGAGRLSGPRGARSDQRTGTPPRQRSTPGRNCTPASLGTAGRARLSARSDSRAGPGRSAPSGPSRWWSSARRACRPTRSPTSTRRAPARQPDRGPRRDRRSTLPADPGAGSTPRPASASRRSWSGQPPIRPRQRGHHQRPPGRADRGCARRLRRPLMDRAIPGRRQGPGRVQGGAEHVSERTPRVRERARAGDNAGMARQGRRAARVAAHDRPIGRAGRSSRAWEVERLDPALARAPERQARFRTLGEIDLEPALRPVVARRTPTRCDDIGLPGEPPFTRGIHPSGYRSRLWTMRMFAGFGAAEDTNAPVQGPARGRPDRPVDRLRHADAVRLRHGRPGGRGRVRDVRRGRLLARRHGGPARRPAARPRLDVDDDQLAGRPDLGDVHRRRREGGRARAPAWRARPRTTSSRSSSPRRSSCSRRSRRCAS